MVEEKKEIHTLNLDFENKFNDEYFIQINGIDDYLFEDNIYISNFFYF